MKIDALIIVGRFVALLFFLTLVGIGLAPIVWFLAFFDVISIPDWGEATEGVLSLAAIVGFIGWSGVALESKKKWVRVLGYPGMVALFLWAALSALAAIFVIVSTLSGIASR